MHIAAFAPASAAVLQNDGGVTAQGFPMTSALLDVLPKRIAISIVLSVYSEAGNDHNPRRYIVVKSPDGDRSGSLEVVWDWPDTPGEPVKHRVFVHHVTVDVNAAGVYDIGLYDSPEATDSIAAFPLPIALANPLLTQQA